MRRCDLDSLSSSWAEEVLISWDLFTLRCSRPVWRGDESPDAD